MQRQGSDLAIRRTTPTLFGLYSLVTLVVQQQDRTTAFPVCQPALYSKDHPTFAAALALVRRDLCQQCPFRTSPEEGELVKVPRSLLDRLTDALAYAA
jgi:hypothetical protein